MLKIIRRIFGLTRLRACVMFNLAALVAIGAAVVAALSGREFGEQIVVCLLLFVIGQMVKPRRKST